MYATVYEISIKYVVNWQRLKQPPVGRKEQNLWNFRNSWKTSGKSSCGNSHYGGQGNDFWECQGITESRKWYFSVA